MSSFDSNLLKFKDGEIDLKFGRRCAITIQFLETHGSISPLKLELGIALFSLYEQTELGRETFSLYETKYGPRVNKFDEVLSRLQEVGIVCIEEHGDDRVCYLPESFEGGASFDILSKDDEELIEWLIKRHVSKSVSFLLSFLYRRYDESDV